MYKALETVILEDVFGRDNQYLKGHNYNLTYNDSDTVEYNGRRIQRFLSHYLLSEDDRNKYFTYIEQPVIRGGRGIL
jgi:hypothetical protein